LPHHDHGHVEGIESEHVQVDIDPYGLDDNLHMHDLKHEMLGERRQGDDRRSGEAAPAEEARKSERRQADTDQGEQK
jgi:C4-dicarboxylate transporter DctQ subunit